MGETAQDTTLHLQSGVHAQTGAGMVFLHWGTVHAMIDPALALETAADLHAAATRAETDIALIDVLTNRVGMDLRGTAMMLQDVREKRAMPSGKSALRVSAVAGAGTGKPYVHIARGSMKGSMTPDEARAEATNWAETATAARFDARLRYVLTDYPQLSAVDIDGIFTGLRHAGGMA